MGAHMFSKNSMNLGDLREMLRGSYRRMPRRIVRSVTLAAVMLLFAAANAQAGTPKWQAEAAPIQTVELNEPGGQILSFRHLYGGTLVHMKGTRIEPMATAKMKIGSRRGFVEIDETYMGGRRRTGRGKKGTGRPPANHPREGRRSWNGRAQRPCRSSHSTERFGQSNAAAHFGACAANDHGLH